VTSSWWFRVVARTGVALRDLWFAIGIALGIFLVFEAGYRVQARLRRTPVTRPVNAGLPPLHPYAGQQWFREFVSSDRRTDHFDPYRGYWSDPFSTRYKNVDSLGRRVTIQPRFDPATARRIFLLGGSTMFGFNSRDSLTIPSLVASQLHAQGLQDLEVVNLGQGGFTVTQEATTLLVELARGRPPAAAAFLDGTNDIHATWRLGEPGHHPAEARTQRFIELGSRSFGAELVGLGRHSQLILRLQQALGMGSLETSRPVGVRICGSLAAYYANLAREVRAIGQGFDFPVFFFQQPMHGTTHKRLTAWERTIRSEPLIRPCATSMDSAMSSQTGRSYFSLAGLFDTDTVSVYTDKAGHVTEQANEAIAARMAFVVGRALRAQPVRQSDSSRPGPTP
jgi:hypothetical protein